MLFVFLLILDYIVSRCGLDILKSKRVLVNSVGEKQDRYLSKQTFEPLRVELDFSLIENSLDKLNKQDFIDLKEKIMPKTKKVFEDLLKVQRIEGKLRFNAKKCDDFYIPEKYLAEGDGVDADLVIFIAIDDTGYFKENGIEAAAIHCLQHSVTKRPVAGFITFKPDLNVDNPVSLNYQVWLAVHEISHILAINDSLYYDFVDKNLQPLGIDKIVTTRSMSYRNKNQKDYNFRVNHDKIKNDDKERLTGIDETVNVATSKISKIKYYMPNRKSSSSQTISYIKSPKVLEKAKSHFNCDSLVGVPLEFNGGAGTNGAHWSKRFMGSDYMIGDSYGENLISEITLALFEDSGWYKVDYSLANLFLFGKNKGCGFLDENCVNPVKSTKNKNFKSREEEIKFKTSINSNFSEFCTDTSAPVCSQHNIFRGVCAIRKYDYELPLYEQHFNDPTIGGVDRLSERCPIPIEAKRGQNFYGGSCREGKKAYKYEKIGSNSSCFITNLKVDSNSSSFLQIEDNDKSEEVLDTFEKSDVYSKNGRVAACFEFICKSNSLYVLVDDKEYKCVNGKAKNIEGYTGEIECPDKEVLCHDKYKCKFGCTDEFNKK